MHSLTRGLAVAACKRVSWHTHTYAHTHTLGDSNKLNDNNAFSGEWVLLVVDINVLKSILMFSNIYA